MKPLYFWLAIKISAGVSLPLAPMFLGNFYVQLDILWSDRGQASSCHIVTTSVHNTIPQHLLYERCARLLAKCRPVRFAKERYLSCPRVITDFCGRFKFDFPLAFRWVGLKPIDHPAVEFFDKGVGFSWKVYRNLGTSYTCADSIMGPFVDTARTITQLTGFEERGITYLAATNTGWLPYLADEGVRCKSAFFLQHSGPRILGQIVVVWWTRLGSPQLRSYLRTKWCTGQASYNTK